MGGIMKTEKQKVECKGFLHAEKHTYNGTIEYRFFHNDMSAYGYILLQPHTFEAEINPYDLNALTIDTLKAKKKAVEAEACVKVQAIEDEILKLLSIEDKS